MKNLYITLSLLVIGISAMAQNKDTKTADKFFSRYEYVTAAKEYLKLVDAKKADAYVYKQLADTYYNVFNVKEAINWYAKATSVKQDAEVYFRYAQMLKANKNYDGAAVQMKKFVELAPNDSRAKAFNQNPNYVTALSSKEPSYVIKPVDINSDKSEFGAVLYGNELFFTSARNTARKVYGWDKEPFLDVYKSIKGDTGLFSQPTLVTSLNTKSHDGPVTITKDGNTIYFTSDSFRENAFEKDKKNNTKNSRNYLYKAKKSGDSWIDIKPLPFNNKSYSTSNPSISRDGKTLYFTSNMPNGIGGADIWKVAVKEDGTYGTPENLGKKVNTEGNESFPFIADDNATLYFASTGRQGLGGLDIYKVDLNKADEAINVGKPLNSEKDDFGFTFNAEKKLGYFSTNRVLNDDIYEATPICSFPVQTLVSDASTGRKLGNSKVSITDDKNKVVDTQITNDLGEVNFKVGCDKPYSVEVSSDGFEPNVFQVAASQGTPAVVEAKLKQVEVIVTEKEIILSPIYFEYDKSNITEQGATELDKLIKVLQEKTALVIFVKSHTDNKGDDGYNLKLSDRRAKSTVAYIISKGISADRITGKGFGESELKEPCGETCTEEQDAINRRSEFLIVK